MFVGQLIVLKHFDQQVETFTKVLFEIFVISVGKCSFGKKKDLKRNEINVNVLRLSSVINVHRNYTRIRLEFSCNIFLVHNLYFTSVCSKSFFQVSKNITPTIKKREKRILPRVAVQGYRI